MHDAFHETTMLANERLETMNLSESPHPFLVRTHASPPPIKSFLANSGIARENNRIVYECHERVSVTRVFRQKLSKLIYVERMYICCVAIVMAFQVLNDGRERKVVIRFRITKRLQLEFLPGYRHLRS